MFRTIFVLAIAVTLASIPPVEMILRIFVAALHFGRLPNVLAGIVAVVGIALSVIVGFLCFVKLHKYLENTFINEREDNGFAD